MIFDKDGVLVEEFESQSEAEIMIVEAAMLDCYSGEELEQILENSYDLGKAINEDILEERTIVRLDKFAKKKRAEKMAIFQIAKQKKDRDFKKLLTIWKLERFLEEKLTKRYGAQAKSLAKQTMKNAGKTKSKTVDGAVSKAKKLFNK